MKTLLVSHRDLDGISPVIITQFYKIPITNYQFKDYDFLEDPDFNQLLLKYDKIYITDLGVQEETYNILEKNNKEFYVFDHHEKTQDFKNKENVFFSLEKSGTELFFEYLTKGKRTLATIKEFVTLVTVYDLWKLEHPLRKKAERLNKLVYEILNYKMDGGSYGRYQDFITRQLHKLQTEKIFEFTPYELDKIQVAEMKEKNALECADGILQQRTDQKGYLFGITKSNRKISYLCSKLLDKYSKMSYIICINVYSNDGKISVRSKKPFSVLNLKDVDGHREAGGGMLNQNFILNLWNGSVHELGYQ